MQKEEPKDQNAKMIKILSGEMAIELHLQFLIRNNNTDLMILKNTKVIEGSKRQMVWRAIVYMVQWHFHICFSFTSGCSPKLGVPHSHSNSQLFHAHRNHKRPVPQVTPLPTRKLVCLCLTPEMRNESTPLTLIIKVFLWPCRENLEWLARATNWAKFTATASLGVIHKVRQLLLTAVIIPCEWKQSIKHFIPDETFSATSFFPS